MFESAKKYASSFVRCLLIATAFTPLAFSSKFLYPYIVPKTFFVRGLVQIALAVAIILFLDFLRRQRLFSSETGAGFLSHLKNLGLYARIKEKLGNSSKLLLFFGVFFVFSQITSLLFSEFPYRAFWGSLERGGGVFNFLHFIAFFLLVLIFFTKREFERYFKFSVAVGIVVYFYAILQALGVRQFPFAFSPNLRPGSFLGNPAFLSAYSFFVTISAIATLWFLKKKNGQAARVWFYLSFVALFLAPIIIFITRTRGAIIGLGVSVALILFYFAFRKKVDFSGKLQEEKTSQIPEFSFVLRMLKKINSRTLSISILAVLFIFSATLFFTRGAGVWQKIPGLDRITQTLSFFNIEASAQTRISGWRLAVNSFLEKPILGWGPEHYLVAFEKRDSSEFDAYGEVWLDRAHNSVLDVAVTQGLVGLVSYLGFLFYLLLFFFRNGEGFYLRFFVGVVFLGFVVQNLFLLEEFHVFAPFFVIVGAVAMGVFGGRFEKSDSSVYAVEVVSKNTPVLIGGSIIVLLVLFASLYKTVLIPTSQAYYTHKLEAVENKEDFLRIFNKATQPYNFAQYSIRSYTHDYFYANQGMIFTDPKFADAGNKIVNSITEILEREGSYDIRSHIRLSQAYQEMAKQDPPIKDPVLYYRAGEEVLRKAIAISPFTQELIYGLGFALTGQGKYEEAIDIMGKSVALNPKSSRIARLHYYYGLVLLAAGRNDEAKEEFDRMKTTDPTLGRFTANDIRGLFKVYESLGEYDRIVDIVTESARGLLQTKIDLEYYEVALSYQAIKRNSEAMIVIAQFISDNFPERENDMEAIIDLVKSGRWEILQSL